MRSNEVMEMTQGRQEPVTGSPAHRHHTAELWVKVVRDVYEFASYAVQWNRLVEACPVTIYQTFEWQFLWWKHFGKNRRRSLHILVFHDERRLVGIMPLFVEAASFGKLRLCNKLQLLGCGVPDKRFSPTLEEGPSDYLDGIVHPDYESEVARAFVDYLRQHHVLYDEIELRNIAPKSFLSRHVVPLLHTLDIRCNIVPSDICPQINVPASAEEFIESVHPNMRRRLRQVRKAAASAGGQSIEKPDSQDALVQTFHDLVHLHQQRWNHLGYPGLFADRRFENFAEELTKEFWERGVLWVKSIRMGGVCIAARLGFKFKDRIYDYLSGFDDRPMFAKRRAGLALLLSMVEDAIESGIPIVDLLRGNEEYKFELTSAFNQNQTVVATNRMSMWKVRFLLYRGLHSLELAGRRFTREWLIMRIHYREHGAWSFLFRHIARFWERLLKKIQ